MDNCILCQKRPIFIKKRGLCRACYEKEYQRNLKTGTSFSKKFLYPRELLFVKNFFNHKNWRYNPATFRLDDTTYAPDFYDGERNVFIEVSGTRQAYHENKEKYRKFCETFPLIKFEIRDATGNLIEI